MLYRLSLFCAVMIGLTLGVTSGTSFTTLLVALSFHQFFEGFAIGSAAVDSGLGAVQACAMGLVFSVTTPAGIAVGEARGLLLGAGRHARVQGMAVIAAVLKRCWWDQVYFLIGSGLPAACYICICRHRGAGELQQ